MQKADGSGVARVEVRRLCEAMSLLKSILTIADGGTVLVPSWGLPDCMVGTPDSYQGDRV